MKDYPDRDIYLVTIYSKPDCWGNPTKIWVTEPDASKWAEQAKRRPNDVKIQHQMEVGS